MSKPGTRTTWAGLAAGKGLTLAVDTEYQEAKTLTIQFAVRVGDTVRMQLYHAPDIPPPPRGCLNKAFTSRFPTRVLVCPPKPISVSLSPARVLADIMELPVAEFRSRVEGDAHRPPNSGHRGRKNEPNRLPRIGLVLVGHFIRADLLRAFGREFYSKLLTPIDRAPSVALREGRVIGFIGTGGNADKFTDPVVEYVDDGSKLYELRLGTMDTNCVCGPTKLDELARTYAGVAKDESIDDADKPRMRAVFCDPQRTADAYRYAVQDAVITLLVAERMEEQHGALYAGFGIPTEDVPPMHGTPGLRVANLVLQHARHTAATGSARLGAAIQSAPGGLNKLKELARRGSASALSDGRVTRYGKQTGDTHGGLLYSRTPYTFHHAAPGQFRDLDLKSCYPAIIRPMVAYLGRPVVLERGHEIWTLKKVVEYLRKNADGDHAWFVKASGPILGFANTLVPSTVDGITNENYRSRAVRTANAASLDRKERDHLREGVDDRKYTTLLTDEVNAGVVTWATWLMIQALPLAARRQYENLRAETVVFYPRKLAAGTGAEFDALVAKYRTGRSVDWRQELGLDAMTLTTVEDIDEKFVSLRYPVGGLTDRLVALRMNAGKDSAEGLLYKTFANTVYGAFASPFLPTSNPVAGNVITGTARALAYAMTQAFNAHLVITDGVLYRRDRVPAGTFAARLRQSHDYPLLHAADGPFVEADDIPEDDAAFTDWYVDHALRFFGVAGRSEYESLFRLHALAHKTLSDGGPAFDGVFVDGSANYGKLVRTQRRKWRVADFKARSFRREEKEKLKKWLLRVYRKDQFTGPPPVVPAGRLLTVRDALAQAGRTVSSQKTGTAVVPLGFWMPSLATYKLIKPSALVFRTARQRDRVLRDWRRLTRMTECGPELLAMRRSHGGKLSGVAKALFVLIRSGGERLTALNVDRLWRPKAVGLLHGDEIRERRSQARGAFETRLAAASAAVPLTGLVVDRRSLAALRAAADAVR